MYRSKIALLSFVLIFVSTLYSCQQKKLNNTSLKVMSYNIRHGKGLDDKIDLNRITEIINFQKPNYCGLQEIDKSCERSNNIDQLKFLSEKTHMEGTFGKFMDLQNGEYGMATLTTLPVLSSKVVDLPDGKYEPRTAIVQELKLANNCVIAIANVHLEWIEGEEGASIRLDQAQALLKHLNELNRPSIITGDFNCNPNSETMEYFEEHGFVFVEKGEDNLSFQIGEQMEIDHLVYRNSSKVKFVEKSSKLLVEPIASDHRPLVTELDVVF